MGLSAAAHHIIVKPSGDNTETERDRLIVVQQTADGQTILRGVVLHVGEHIVTPVSEGCLVHYVGFFELEGLHIVPEQHVLAYDDEIH